MSLIEMLAAALLVLASTLVFKEILAADAASKDPATARPVIRRRRQAARPLSKAA